jgi:hypothetical protein
VSRIFICNTVKYNCFICNTFVYCYHCAHAHCYTCVAHLLCHEHEHDTWICIYKLLLTTQGYINNSKRKYQRILFYNDYMWTTKHTNVICIYANYLLRYCYGAIVASLLYHILHVLSGSWNCLCSWVLWHNVLTYSASNPICLCLFLKRIVCDMIMAGWLAENMTWWWIAVNVTPTGHLPLSNTMNI